MRRQLFVALIVAISSSADGSQFSSSLRSTLINANPSLKIHKRTAIEREASSVNPFQPTIRAIKFWRYVGPIVVNYKCTEYWYKIAYKNDPVSRIKDAYHVHKFDCKDTHQPHVLIDL